MVENGIQEEPPTIHPLSLVPTLTYAMFSQIHCKM